MIPLEQQVCTLEQAKIFKDEFGLELDSYWRWCDWDCDKWELVTAEDSTEGDDSLPAYTCAELGEVLPHSIIYGGSGYVLYLQKTQIQWSCYYAKSINRNSYLFDQTIEGEYAAETQADLLIDGLRKGYIKPEDLKL